MSGGGLVASSDECGSSQVASEDISEWENHRNYSIHRVKGGEAIGLTYVKGLLTAQEIEKTVSFCFERNGFTLSPSGDLEIKKSRTSSSCPLIWPMLYLPRMKELESRLTTSIKNEIDWTWELTQRFAKFLQVEESRVEPLQLVRYEPGQFYRRHHDHGSYYQSDAEQRSLTMLVFLTSMPRDNGGQTYFPDLDIAVLPTAGDAVIWDNERDNAVLDEAVHEAIPPTNDAQKIAMNVWISKVSLDPTLTDELHAYRTI